MLQFEWDDLKAVTNLRKHGVDFETAKQVFDDPSPWEMLDPMSADYGEERFKIIGHGGGRLLSVIYTMRGERIRLISVRIANRKEHDNYQSQSPAE